MKNRFYMKEFQYHDGECYVTFNIVDLNELKNEISVAITREGKAGAEIPRLGTNVINRNFRIVMLCVVALNQGINAIAVTDEDFMTAVYGLAQNPFYGIIERIDFCGTGYKDLHFVFLLNLQICTRCCN